MSALPNVLDSALHHVYIQKTGGIDFFTDYNGVTEARSASFTNARRTIGGGEIHFQNSDLCEFDIPLFRVFDCELKLKFWIVDVSES